jgi:hypothetical protein
MGSKTMSQDKIRSHLNRLHTEISRARFSELTFTFLRYVVLGVFLVALVDFFFHVDFYVLRLIFLAGAIGYALSKMISLKSHPIYKELSERELAEVFERRYPELEGQWVAALEFEGREEDPLILEYLQNAEKSTATISDERMVLPGPLRELRRMALFTLVVLLALFCGVEEGRIAAQRLVLNNVLWPTKNDLDMSKIVTLRPKGEPFRVAVRPLEGRETPGSAMVRIRSDNGDRLEYEMSRTGGGQLYAKIAGLKANSELRISGGDFSSSPVKIRVVERPRVNTLTVTAAFPDYISREEIVFPTQNRIFSAVQGSMIQLHIKANKKITKATLELGDGKLKQEMKVQGDILTLTLPLEKTGLWRVEMLGSDGFEMSAPLGLRFEALKDQKPQVMVKAPKRDIEMSSFGFFSILGSAKDDYGLKAVELIRERVDIEGNVKTVVFKLDEGLKDQAGDFDWQFDENLGLLDTKVGEIFKYRIIAIDHKGQKGQSKSISVSVVDQKDLMGAIEIKMMKIKNMLEAMKDREEAVLVLSKGIKAGLENGGRYRNEDMSRSIEKQSSQEKAAEQVTDVGDDIMRIIEGNRLNIPNLVLSLERVAELLKLFREDLSPKALKDLENVRRTKKGIDEALKSELLCLEAIESLINHLKFGQGIVEIIETFRKIIEDQKKVQGQTDEDR